MLITKKIITKWNSKTKQYYEQLEYVFTKMGQEFEVLTTHLKPSSKELVMIKCDFQQEGCRNQYEKSYFDYYKVHQKYSDGKDCCQNGKCRKHHAILTNLQKYNTEYPMLNIEIQNKSKLNSSLKYGTTNPSYSDEIKNKIQQIHLQKFGVKNVFQSEMIKTKIKQTIQNKYGVEYAAQNKEVKEKTLQTKIQRYGNEKGIIDLGQKKENHWNWKGGISELNHILRTSTEYKSWRTDVFIRDSYTCQKCGQVGGKLNAHHVNDWVNFEDERFSCENGVTFCKTCHIEFHKTYKSPNNINQLLDYINNYDKKIC